MADLDVGFEWPVSNAGYRLRTPRVKPRLKGRSRRTSWVFPQMDAALSPAPGRGPYAPVPRNSALFFHYIAARGTVVLPRQVMREIDASPRIVAKGKGERLHRPLEYHRTLYLEFAKLDGTDQSCLEFANRFGLLGLNPKGRGEALVLWQDAIIGLAKAIELSQSDRRALEGYWILPLQGALRPSPPDGRLVFRLSPGSLMHAMQLQFVHAISSGLTIKVCRLCGDWFEAGGDLRRRDAQFCSKEHKVNYFNLEKRRGAP